MENTHDVSGLTDRFGRMKKITAIPSPLITKEP